MRQKAFVARFGFVLLFAFFASLVGGIAKAQTPASGSPQVAAQHVSGGAAPSIEYVWIAGSSFQTRDGTSAFETTRNGSAPGGCIYSTSSGEFTSDLQLPNDSTIISVTTYLRNTGDGPISSTLGLRSGNGRNSTQNLLTHMISATVGYTASTAPVPAPYTVDMANRNVYLEWTPSIFNNSIQLCGVRVAYTPPPAPLAQTDFRFIAGSVFGPRDAVTDYGYAGGGCTFLKNAGRYLEYDVDLPEGALLYTLNSYVRDITDTADLKVELIESNAQGLTMTLATATEAISDTGFHEVSTDVSGLNYRVHEITGSLTLRVDFQNIRSTALRFCGVRFEFGQPSPVTRDYRFVTGDAFQIRRSDVTYLTDDAGCITATNQVEDFTAHIQIPQGATIKRVTYYYRQGTGGPQLKLFAYDGQGAPTTIATVVPAASASFGNNNAAPLGAVVVDNATGGLALYWDPGTGGPQRALCGAQVEFSFVNYLYLPVILKN